MTESSTPTRTSSPAISSVRFELFAIVWALANIVHLTNQSHARIDTPTGWLNLVAAVYVLLNPRSINGLVVLAVAQLADVLWEAPFMPDHAVLGAAVNVTIIMTYARLRRRGASGGPSLASFMERAASPARVVLLMAYSAAALAKYNQNFFEPAHSCATYLADVATFGASGDRPLLGPVHIGLTAGVETLVPILLMFVATRRIGARLGIVFHFLVSLSPVLLVGDFTVTLWALFLLFLPDDDLESIMAGLRQTVADSPVATAVRSINPVVRAAVIVTIAGAAGFIPGYASVGAGLLVWATVNMFGLVLVGAVLRASRASAGMPAILFRPTAGQAALFVVLFLWILNPYLGFRTSSSFTMFSGLETEGPGTNHFFLPSVHLVDFQNDLAVLVSSDDEVVMEAAEDGRALPFFEIERGIADSDTNLTVTRAGETLIITDANRQGFDPPPYLLRKTLHFRPVALPDGEPFCSN